MKASFSEKIPCLPFQLEQRYTVRTTYKWDDEGFTCLVKEKDTKQLQILKYYKDPLRVRSLITEKELLDSIHQEKNVFAASFPRAEELIQQEGEACLIREYIHGQTLEDICESGMEQPGIELFQALDYVIQTVELLDFLHSMEKPMIHRDIKPQNIVIDSEGKCHLIDLGISRFYQEGKCSDTERLGTRLTAPPEQFGYQQTDIRSDLYSAGVLLFYCLTGEYNVHMENGTVCTQIPDPVMRIIRKATKFDPEQRYHSAGVFMRDLLEVRYGRYIHSFSNPAQDDAEQNFAAQNVAVQNSAAQNVAVQNSVAQNSVIQNSAVQKFNGRKPTAKARIIFSAAALLILLIGALGISMLKKASVSDADFYMFREPLLEAAVRQELGLSDKEKIRISDLDRVTAIHILGQQIYHDESEIWYNAKNPWFYDDAMREVGLYQHTGSITSLEDIKSMPNLRELYLGKQQIEDLSALKGMELTRLGLAYNPISDFTPLEGNIRLMDLNLAGCKIESPDFLATLTRLESLTLTAADIRTLKPLEQLSVKKLELYEVKLPDYRELQYVPKLTSLSFQFFSPDWISYMEGLELEELILTNTSNFELNTLNAFPKLRELYCGGQSYEPVKLKGLKLPELCQLTLYAYTVEDFSDLAETKISRLEIYGCDVKDYQGLDKMACLQEISCTKEQAETIEKQYPEHHWRLIYPL